MHLRYHRMSNSGFNQHMICIKADITLNEPCCVQTDIIGHSLIYCLHSPTVVFYESFQLCFVAILFQNDFYNYFLSYLIYNKVIICSFLIDRFLFNHIAQISLLYTNALIITFFEKIKSMTHH